MSSAGTKRLLPARATIIIWPALTELDGSTPPREFLLIESTKVKVNALFVHLTEVTPKQHSAKDLRLKSALFFVGANVILINLETMER
ncbi:10852_t:CDS:2 [Funneliformis caledonium]|uniref:10852_t:CDS:1 n=1 Tax=Funneliformis caledonium TaxID=1117310 RepID=A0A9N9IL85_9GLOM|nr:10852_t:CDS:2 [Funneliformis caledonium]